MRKRAQLRPDCSAAAFEPTVIPGPTPAGGSSGNMLPATGPVSTLRFSPEPADNEHNQPEPRQIHDQIDHHCTLSGVNLRSRLALVTTVTEENAMAAPPIMGLSSMPSAG